MDAAWPVFVDSRQGERFAAPGWVALLREQDLQAASYTLDETGWARVHVEAAALFRQAALADANGIVQQFGDTPSPGDPVETAHLLAVSYALRGELDEARAQSARLTGDEVTAPWHRPWADWLSAGAEWPPDLRRLPVRLPALEPTAWPDVRSVSYTLPDGSAVGDPSGLVALSLWHEEVAVALAGREVVDTALVPYRLPVEPDVRGAPLPLELVVGSDLLVPEDGPFFADLLGEMGPGAVDAHADRSLTALLASRARVDGQVDFDAALEQGRWLRRELLRRRMPWVLRLLPERGLIESLARVAGAEGRPEVEGKLRLAASAMDPDLPQSPADRMALVAWDLGHRYPDRAAPVLDDLERLHGSLGITRYGVELLTLRGCRGERLD